MTLKNITLPQYISGILRKAVVSGDLTDYNTSRTSNYGNWIYPDAPKITKLLNNANNFPRVSVECVTDNTIEEMGIGDPSHLGTYTIKIIVWSVHNLMCVVETTSDETIVYDSGETIYELSNLPTSKITMVDDGTTTFVSGTDYQLIDNDGDGFYDSIEWMGVDTPVDTTNFYVDYKRVMSEDELVRYIAQDINTYLRTWRNWEPRIVWGYNRISSLPVRTDEVDHGIYKYEIVCQFTGIDVGDVV